MRIDFIVNGETVPIEHGINTPLFVGMREALDASNNTARPLEEWEVRDQSGGLLDRTISPTGHSISDGAILFVTLRLGAGGDA